LYAAADIAFVGGSLVATGGHNFLEPAALGVPVIAGPHVFNFTDISRLLIAAGGMCQIDTAEQLAEQLKCLIEQPDQRRIMGESARAVVQNNGGAQQHVFELVERYLA